MWIGLRLSGMEQCGCPDVPRPELTTFARLHDSQRSYFVTLFTFVSLIQGCVLLLLKLGVCCKSLI